MSISFACSSCGYKLNAPDGCAGRKSKCPKCGSAVIVPGPTTEVSASTRPQAPRPVFTTCPFCGEDILATAKKCKHCGEWLDVTLRAAEEAKRAVSDKGTVQKQPAVDALPSEPRRRPDRFVGLIGMQGNVALNEAERTLLFEHEDVYVIIAAKHGPKRTVGYLMVTNLRVIFIGSGGFGVGLFTGAGNLTFEHKDIKRVEETGLITRTLTLDVFGRTETFTYSFVGAQVFKVESGVEGAEAISLETFPALIREMAHQPPSQTEARAQLLATDELVAMLPADGLSRVVSVRCPLCKREQTAPYRMVGKKAQCIGCDKAFTVPPGVNPALKTMTLVNLVIFAVLLAIAGFCCAIPVYWFLR